MTKSLFAEKNKERELYDHLFMDEARTVPFSCPHRDPLSFAGSDGCARQHRDGSSRRIGERLSVTLGSWKGWGPGSENGQE